MSARLKGELVHPNRSSWLVGLRFSPDGKRIVAGDYPGGVAAVWDAATGKQLAAIETGSGYRGSAEYLFLSPDWKTLYVSREKRKATRVEKSGKRVIHWEFEGDVRAWDISTGELGDTLKHSPPRGISGMLLSPDGTTVATFEELSGESDPGPKRAASLWDVKTRQCRPLSDALEYWSVFSPDSKILASPVGSPSGWTTAIKLIDVGTAKEKVAIPIVEKNVRVGYLAFSPDGKELLGQVREDEGRHWLRFWDATTGQETASLEGDKNDVFLWMAFSPDGRTLAATNSRGEQGKLFLFDPKAKRLVKTITLGEATKEERQNMGQPVFSPDGKWLALSTQRLPRNARAELDSLDLPQPRIHLIDVAAGEIRETLIAPQSFLGSACFSPDGRTLASGGYGRVLLWDMTKLPGQTARVQE